MVTGHGKLFRRGLGMLRVALIAAIPLWIVVSLMRPHSVVVPHDSPTKTDNESMVSSKSEHELAWYSPLWTRNLKEPPIPKEIPQSAPTPEPPRNLPVLLATLVESEGRYAHFASPSGNPRLRSVDELIDDYRVLAIEPGRVQLQRSNKLVWVEIPKTASGQ